MTQQQPFESQQPIMTEHITSGDKRLAEMLREHDKQSQHDDLDSADYAEADRQRVREEHTLNEQPEYKTWSRHDKLDFLLDTCSEQFKAGLLDEIVNSMTEDQFTETYEYITRMHGIARDYQELDRMSQIPQ